MAIFDSETLRGLPWASALIVVTTFVEMSEDAHLCPLMVRPFYRIRSFLAEVLSPEEFLELERRILR